MSQIMGWLLPWVLSMMTQGENATQRARLIHLTVISLFGGFKLQMAMSS